MKPEDIRTHMKPENKLDSLKFLAQLQRDEFHNRQKHEWKILFAALTVYALSVSTVLNYPGSFETAEIAWLPYFFLLIALIYSIYRIFIQRKNHKNKSYAHQAENAIEEILRGEDPNINIRHEEECWRSPKHLWSTICHIAIVLLFALVACIMIRSIASKEETIETRVSVAVETVGEN